MVLTAEVLDVEPNAEMVIATPVTTTQWQYEGDDGWID